MEKLALNKSIMALVGKIALCHGLFSDSSSEDKIKGDYYMLKGILAEWFGRNLLQGIIRKNAKDPVGLMSDFKITRELYGADDALISELLLAEGIFLKSQKDLSRFFVKTKYFDHAERSLGGDGDHKLDPSDFSPMADSGSSDIFEKYYMLGSTLWSKSASAAIRELMAGLDAGAGRQFFVAKIALSRGVMSALSGAQNIFEDYNRIKHLIRPESILSRMRRIFTR
jgi:hypothetical protein